VTPKSSAAGSRAAVASRSSERAIAGPRLATDVAWYAAVGIAYAGATVLAARSLVPAPDRMMVLAQQLAAGRLDSPAFTGTTDSVTHLGRSYMAVEPLLPVAYLAFVPFPSLHAVSGYVAAAVLGLLAAWLALPLARAYGAAGRSAYWAASLTAFGTLLFFESVFGDFYYTAQVEAFLALTAFLLEWAGRRRPLLLGTLLALAVLARAPTVLAGIPFAVGLALTPDGRLRRLVAFGAPIVGAGLVYAAYDWARFGSPLETGYAISVLTDPSLAARRAQGLFSLAQLLENIRLAFLTGPTIRSSAPFVLPSPYGLSMLLVSPGLLIALRAGIRTRTARLLWAAAGLVAIPIFLYYGGGYVQYGFRYSLDFTPFLVALVAVGLRRGAGRLDQVLIVLSVVSVGFGILWHARVLGS
jgi:hypothetical protein